MLEFWFFPCAVITFSQLYIYKSSLLPFSNFYTRNWIKIKSIEFGYSSNVYTDTGIFHFDQYDVNISQIEGHRPSFNYEEQSQSTKMLCKNMQLSKGIIWR